MNEKHLDFLQNIVTRLSNHSFLIKGWSVSLLTALYALAQYQSNESFIVITYYPLIIFWILDSYYLHLERVFRDLYKKAANNELKVYSISKNDSDINTFKDFTKCLFSVSTCPLYIVSILVTSFLICQ